MTWTQLEPHPGAGLSPAGDPSSSEFAPHFRGAGDPTTKWAEESSVSTDWSQLEPVLGFGKSPFGHPSDGEFRIHDRGFGLPTTKWTKSDEA